MEPSSIISNREDISSVFTEQTPGAKHNDLSYRFSYVRKIRGDGNCFYRAFCFAYLESIQKNDRILQRFKERLVESGVDLSSVGFDENSFKDHLDKFIDVVEQFQADAKEETLLKLFNEQSTSDSIVQYLRLLASTHLQNHGDFFCNFVEAPCLKTYCKQEVETMAMECDHVDILALSQALDVGINIVSIEGREDQLVQHIIPEGATPCLHLLFHTSHYDILYLRSQH